MDTAFTVLVVDDDAAVCWALEQALASAGYRVQVAADAAIARRLLRRAPPDLVITDVRMPGESGLDLLAWIRAELAGLPVVVSTAHGTIETAVQAVARGAFDYLPKPLDLDRTLAVVARALGEQSLAAAARPGGPEPQETMVGTSAAMQEVFRRVASAAGTDLGVLITGPAGSGKELVARALHRFSASARAAGPFVVVGCGALPEAQAESELFGDGERRGLIASAEGGTLFLDEVSELPRAAQGRLLGLLGEGGGDGRAAAVRVVAATGRDLQRLAASGAFREDLAWRLKVVTIPIPPLAERLDDLPALVRHLLARIARRLGRALSLTDDAMARLRRHSWPGNVRELKHVLEEAAVLAGGGVVGAEHLGLPPAEGAAPAPGQLRALLQAEAGRLCASEPGQVHRRLVDLGETAAVSAALAHTGGNQLRAAELLGINRTTLKKRMDELGISADGR
ncbi:MAG: sigma-54 dependent transcriptional regulator [Planctomycetes bacterium]|nr:sigma-54 dependent transcriptional regulator [Planctomycetota bacterium]